jgi:predicted nucleotidyltransferase
MEQNNGKLFELLNELAKAGMKFVICGGVACVLYGVERTTHDIDISIDFSEENLKKLLEVTKRFNLIPRIPEPVESLFDEAKRKQWVEDKNALVYTFQSSLDALQLDIFLSYPKTFEELEQNAEMVLIGGSTFFVSSIDDLLTVKKAIEPLREKDKQDINELEKILREKNKPGNR